MKRADLKPGVVYAFKDGRREVPGVIVATDTLVKRVNWRNQGEGLPMFEKTDETRPRTENRFGYTYSVVGYPVVIIHDDTPENREKALGVTLNGFIASRYGDLTPGLSYTVVPHLPHILGEYDDFMERRQREHEELQEIRRRAEQERQEQRERVDELRARVSRVLRLSEDQTRIYYEDASGKASIPVDVLALITSICEQTLSLWEVFDPDTEERLNKVFNRMKKFLSDIEKIKNI